jgi:hypothetical protein
MKTIKVSLLFSLFLGFSAVVHACDSTVTLRHPNGNKSLVKKYDNGLPCGKWSYYSEQQRLTRKEKYKDGLLVFTWIYNDEGRIAETINKKGKHKKYHPCNCK